MRVHPTVRIDVGPDGLLAERGVKVSDRCHLVAPSGARIELGREVWIAEDCLVEAAGVIRVGAATTIQRRTSLVGNVEIGQHCILAPNIFISSGAHPIRRWPHLSIRDQERLMVESGESLPDSPVIIGDDCWLGVNVVVSPGVTIGQGAVVGANSVVTKDVAPYTVVAGVPARQISERLAWSPPASLDFTDPASVPYLTSADVSVTNEADMLAMATPRTSIHVRASESGEGLTLDIDVLEATNLSVSGESHLLSSVGRASIVVPPTSTMPITLDAPTGTVRLLAIRSVPNPASRPDTNPIP